MSLHVDIRKRLGSFTLDVAFTAEYGVTSLLGASGCGKSMTLKCIAGIEKPDEGRIELDGRVLFDSAQGINLPPQKRRVGYLFQNYALFPNMTVRQNILCGLNREKSRVTRVTTRENFKFLGFAFRKYKDDILIRVHPKSLKKAKAKLHELTRRNQGRNVRQVMEKQKLYMQGWLNYYGLADMKTVARDLDQWLRRRYRMYIWKQWKKPKTRFCNLRKLDVPEYHAKLTAGSRKAYWAASDFPAVKRAITNERLERAGYFNISKAYESIHEACILRTIVHTL